MATNIPVATNIGPCAAPPCPAVAITAVAVGATVIRVTVDAGGPVDIELGGQTALAVADGASHDFVGLTAGQAYTAIAINECGEKAAVSVLIEKPVVYCPGYRFETCGCADCGYAYYDNALKDPAATAPILDCTGDTVAWIYPTAGVTGEVRHEIPYYDGATLVGYLANNSTCAGPACGSC